MFSLMLFANVILGLRSLVGKLNPVFLSVAHLKVWRRICTALHHSFSPWWTERALIPHPAFAVTCFLWISVSSFEHSEMGHGNLQGPFQPREDSKTWSQEITWNLKSPLSGTFSHESYFTGWRGKKWMDRTLNKKKKKVNTDVLSWAHLFQGSSALFQKPSAQRYPATCHWLTGTEQSWAYVCSFNLTWEIKKAKGRMDQDMKGQAAVLGWNAAQRAQGTLWVSFAVLPRAWGGGPAPHGPFTGWSSWASPFSPETITISCLKV